MATCVIEINDAGITASDGEVILLESPGYAVLNTRPLLIGVEAQQSARINPRATNNRFWEQLSLDPLQEPDDDAHHTADLAYHHLQQIWEQIRSKASEIILAVPGTFDKQQLGLLLGIARECDMPVIGLVDASVVAVSQATPRARLLHLDVQLHRLVLTVLSNDKLLARTDVIEVSRAGLVMLYETWASVIADIFVRNTRFDPLHTAETEQALYNKLPEWLSRLAHNPSAVLEMRTGSKTHQITLPRERLLEATADQYEQLVQRFRNHMPSGERPTVLVSHRLAELPGIVDALRALPECDVLPLSRHAVARGALHHKAVISSSGDALKYVTRVHSQAPVEVTARPGEHRPEQPAPTHVLYKARAYGLNEHPLNIGSALTDDQQGIEVGDSAQDVSSLHCRIWRRGMDVVIEDHSATGTYLNDTRIMDSAVVRVGDIVRLGKSDVELKLIELVNTH